VRCGAPLLGEARAEVTRISHNVVCFVAGHIYVRAGSRDGHGEYVCFPCGHPLLFEEGRGGGARRERFAKKVRYLCNLFGHRGVHRVSARDGFNEYACRCGHTFLKRREVRGGKITHPLMCLFAGHFVSFVARRGGYAEYACRNCGHAFCFT
jgi:hypothetical protein